MSADTSELLDRIERGLRALGRSDCLALLRAGAAPERVRSALTELSLPCNEDVAALWGWHNGSDTSTGATLDQLQLFPGFYLFSLEDAAANYRTFRTDPRWTEGWLPLFANGGSDFYVIDLAGDQVGAVRHFRIDAREHPVEFRSLPAMLRTLAAGFDDGVFYVDSDGYLEMNDHAFALLAARMNPTVSWWRR